MTPRWAAGTLYPTGSLVQPLTGGGATSTAITNPGFESGATDWSLGVGMSVGSTGVFAGTKSLACTGVAGVTVALHDESPVNPGQSITASCMYQQGAASAGRNVGQVFLRWFTSGMVQIGSDSDGSQVTSSSGGGYKQSSVTATAPLGAAFVSIGGKVNRNQSNPSYFDNFAWNYAHAVAPAGLIYKAVQPTIGTSDATEPVWPLTVGLQVVDNTVIWEALIATRITYEASPILLSGNFEPTWPESIGGFVSDNTISWEAVPQQVIQAPQSKVVTIASSKVYAADGDIVRYCATVNPLDWTSEDDAGYLPTGLNQYGSNRTVVLNTYRGNVVAMSASTFGNWQVDPDPANITLLDSMEGIGSTYQQAAHPVSNDLFYLAAPGVRTVGIAAGTSNLAAGDAGMPIDPLVQAAVASPVRPLSSYWPGMGQYWLMIRPPLPVVEGPTISGDAPNGLVGDAWAPYQYAITAGDSPIATVSVTDGSLPPGFTVSDSGLLEVTGGIPGTSGNYTFDMTVEDENGLTDTVPDGILILPGPVQWMAAAGFSAGAKKLSPDGIDWSATATPINFPPTDQWIPGTRGQLFRSYDGEVVATTSSNAFGPSCIISMNNTSTWADMGITGLDSPSGDAAKIGANWFVASTALGIGYTQKYVSGVVTGTAWGATTLTATLADLYSAVSPSSNIITKRDDDGVAAGTATYNLTGQTQYGVRLENDGTNVLICWTTHQPSGSDARAHLALTDSTLGVAQLPSPFADIIGGSGTAEIQQCYSQALELWVVAYGTQVAYGPDPATLTLSSHTFPELPSDLKDDGGKFLCCGANGMMEWSADGETWAPLTVTGLGPGSKIDAVVPLGYLT